MDSVGPKSFAAAQHVLSIYCKTARQQDNYRHSMPTNRRSLLVSKRGYLTFRITFGLYWVLLGLLIVLTSFEKVNIKIKINRYNVPSILHCLSCFH